MQPLQRRSDAALCLTKEVFKDLYQCLSANCLFCPYSVLFSSTSYCRHPNRHNFPFTTCKDPHSLSAYQQLPASPRA